MTVVFVSLAALSALAGWLFPHAVHWIGFTMALFYLAMAAFNAVVTLLRSPRQS